MSSLRFRVPDPSRLAEPVWSRILWANSDQTPRVFRLVHVDSGLVVEWETKASGCLLFPWRTERWGEIYCRTGTLIAAEEPYLLPLELARGVLGRSKLWIDEWQRMGLQIPTGILAQLECGLDALAEAAVRQGDPIIAAKHAERALDAAMDSEVTLARHYAATVIPDMAKRSRRSVAMTAHVEFSRHRDAFAGHVPAMPREIDPRDEMRCLAFRWDDPPTGPHRFSLEPGSGSEGSRSASRLPVLGGPLLENHPSSLPSSFLATFPTAQSYWDAAERHVTATVESHRGHVDFWHVAAGFNRPGLSFLSAKERLELTAMAVRRVRELHDDVPVFFSIDQPFGEYLHPSREAFHPLDYTAALVSLGLGLSALGLEFSLGDAPGSFPPRPCIEFLQLVERFSAFNLPLILFASYQGRGSIDGASEETAAPTWISEALIPLLACQRPVMALLGDGQLFGPLRNLLA